MLVTRTTDSRFATPETKTSREGAQLIPQKNGASGDDLMDIMLANFQLTSPAPCKPAAAKLRILHLSVLACFSLACGTRYWTALELLKLRSLQIKMARRIAH